MLGRVAAWSWARLLLGREGSCAQAGGSARRWPRRPCPMTDRASPPPGRGRAPLAGSWTQRRFMGLSGEQVPPQAAISRPPPRLEACMGGRD
ncbi:hypothetical protein P7K49_021236, partial [Saguinus oedipus]